MGSVISSSSGGSIDDVVIIGGGLAGLYCALKLSPRPVTVISSGAISAGAHSRPSDSVIGFDPEAAEKLARKAVAAGTGLADERVMRQMLRDAAERAKDLTSLGVAPDGDFAAMLAALADAVRRSPSIRLLEGYVAEQLRAEGDLVTGLVIRDRRGGLSNRLLIPTRAVVLASGGIGALYESTTNAPEARGEGLAMAAAAGALIADPEFVVFHRPEIDIGGAPAAHHHVGGVHVDGSGRTTLDGLWGCGEVAATGAQGATAIAPVPLLEALVYSDRVAKDIRGVFPSPRITHWSGSTTDEMPSAIEADSDVIQTLRTVMSRHVGPERDRSGLSEAIVAIDGLSHHENAPRDRNALIAARLIVAAALKREESRGVHRRNDFTRSDARWARRTFITLEETQAIAARAASPLRLAS